MHRFRYGEDFYGGEQSHDFAALLPEALLTTYEEGEAKERIEEKLNFARAWADVEAAGPGLGSSREVHWILEKLLESSYREGGSHPLILDADGLNWLSGHMKALKRNETSCDSHSPYGRDDSDLGIYDGTTEGVPPCLPERIL